MARLSGTGTALVTPFKANGTIDEASLRGLVDWQIKSKVEFLVPCGSTGESATMTRAERRRVIEIVVDQNSGRVPIIAGTQVDGLQMIHLTLLTTPKKLVQMLCCLWVHITTNLHRKVFTSILKELLKNAM